MRRKVILFAIIALLLMMLPIITNAEIVESGTLYGGTSWKLDSEGHLTLSGSGTLTMSSSPWVNKVYTVEIEPGITEIGDNFFLRCSSGSAITSITIPNTVTRIGEYAFNGLSSLTSIVIPDSVTEIGNNAFTGCSGLKSVVLSNSMTEIKTGLFGGCSALTEIEIPEGIKTLGQNAFYKCSALTSITIPDSVTLIGTGCFKECTKLVSIITGEGSISNEAFMNCYELSNVTIKGLRTGINKDAFSGCAKLSTINLSSCNSSAVTYFKNNGYAACLSLIPHDFVKTDRIDPTCEETGVAAYWTCSTCGKMFSDEEGTSEITSPIVLSARGHKLVHTEKIDATCTESGVADYWTCSVCNKIYSDKNATNLIDAPVVLQSTGHNLTMTKRVDPSCTEAGTEEYWKCLNCDKLFADMEATAEIASPGIIAATGHSLTKVEKIDATCTKDGIEEYWECSSCSKLFSDKDALEEIDTPVSIPAAGHNLVTTEAVAPTCTETGLTEGKHCSVCGIVLEEQKVIPALGHEWVFNKVITEPTFEQQGEALFSCTRDESHTYTKTFGLTEMKNSSGQTIGKVYYDEYGNMVEGWVELDGKKAYLSKTHRAGSVITTYAYPYLVTSTIQIVEKGKTMRYYFNKDGSLRTNATVFVQVDTYGTTKIQYLDSNGQPKTESGWVNDLNGKYYIDVDGYVMTGFRRIGDDVYYFGDDGVMRTGKHYLQKDNIYKYYDFGEDGKLQKDDTENTNNTGNEDDILAEAESALSSLRDLTSENADQLFYFSYGYYPFRLNFSVNKEMVCTDYPAIVGYKVQGGQEGYTYTAYWEEKVNGEWIKREEFLLGNPAKGVAQLTLDHESELRLCIKPVESDDSSLIQYSNSIFVYSHSGESKTVIADPAVAATCTETGLTEGKHCSVCNEVLVAQETVRALGHDWDEGVVTKEATETEEGIRTYTCARCGETTEESIPKAEAPADPDPVKPEKTGWTETEAGLVYVKEDGTKATDWLEIDGTYYCFDENGVMRTGWYEENGFTYYLGTDGKMATGDVEVDGTVYHFNGGGACTGEATEDPGTPEPATPEARGWVYAATGWIYVKDDGTRATGWLNDGGTWYYMNDSGYMLTGWVGVNGTWYYMQPSGAMATGWVNDGGTWYYMQPSGAMATGWLSDGGTWYYMRPSGAMATGWVFDGNAWYYMKPSGVMATGWMLDRGTWYYFRSSGVMVTGWQRIGGTWYYFHESGAMATGWYEEKDAWGNTTAWYWFDDSGAMATGWKEINGQWEMFADSGAWLYTWDGNPIIATD